LNSIRIAHPSSSKHVSAVHSLEAVFDCTDAEKSFGPDLQLGYLFHFAVAVEKLLDRSKWSIVQFLSSLQQAELHSKFLMQGLGIVADNIETAALHGAFWSERAYDHVPSPPN
jgi:hypothetical protein